MRRTLAVGVLVALGLVVGSSPGASAAPAVAAPTVAVSGQVSAPATYTAAQLDARPQVTVASGRAPIFGSAPVSGASLQALVTASAPLLDAGRNPALRVAVTVRGAFGRAVTLALGELDPGFGNHPAVLTTPGDRVDLVVPGDASPLRTVLGVTGIDVAVIAAGNTTAPLGSVSVTAGGRTTVLSTTLLASLPQRTETVTFSAMGTTTTRTFTGPDLRLALLAIGVFPDVFASSVTATAVDGYGATTTTGEAWFGGRTLLLAGTEDGVALARPRLVTAGDVRGGRFVTDVTALTVTTP